MPGSPAVTRSPGSLRCKFMCSPEWPFIVTLFSWRFLENHYQWQNIFQSSRIFPHDSLNLSEAPCSISSHPFRLHICNLISFNTLTVKIVNSRTWLQTTPPPTPPPIAYVSEVVRSRWKNTSNCFQTIHNALTLSENEYNLHFQRILGRPVEIPASQDSLHSSPLENKTQFQNWTGSFYFP